MFLWYFVVPECHPAAEGLGHRRPTRPTSQFVTAVVCLGLFTSARIAEQVRSGIQSLPRGQRNAGYGDRPDASRRSTATCCCRWPSASSSRRSPREIDEPDQELLGGAYHRPGRADLPHARDRRDTRSTIFEAFAAATLIYIVIAMTANRVMAFIEKRVAVPGYIARRQVDGRTSTSTSSRRSLPYLWKGLQYTVQLTLVAAIGGTRLRHAARDGAAVRRSSRCRWLAAGLREPDALASRWCW